MCPNKATLAHHNDSNFPPILIDEVVGATELQFAVRVVVNNGDNSLCLAANDSPFGVQNSNQQALLSLDLLVIKNLNLYFLVPDVPVGPGQGSLCHNKILTGNSATSGVRHHFVIH